MDKLYERALQILHGNLPGEITWEEVEMMVIALQNSGE